MVCITHKKSRPTPTPEQRECIEHWGSPLLVLAGPGTGKTTVLALRILFLLEEMRIPKDYILAVTFTTKAADEMRKRLVFFGVSENCHPWIATLHAVATRILREHAHCVGLPNNFVIAREADERLMFNDAFYDVQAGKYAKNALKKYKACFDRTRYEGQLPWEVEDENLKSLRKRYANLLRFYHASDFDGLILGAIGILEQHPEVLQQYREKAQFLLIDEYQDINGAQHRLIKLLAGNPNGVFTVGDDDQSIYSWRGGDPKFISSFSKDFPGGKTKILILSQRCPRHILYGALSLVSKNRNRIPKNLSCKTFGDPIRILISKSENAEAKWIAEWIKEQTSQKRYKPSDICVLATDPTISELAFNEVKRQGIEAVRRFKSPLESIPLWLTLSLLQVAINPRDNLAVRVCLTEGPIKGLGPKAVHIILQEAEHNEKTLWDVILDLPQSLSRWRKPLQKFIQYVQRLEQELRSTNTIAFVEKLVNDLRLSNEESVRWLFNHARQAPVDSDPVAFLKWLQKHQTLDPITEVADLECDGKVQFITMHLVKGLESKVVFVIGLEEGLFPDPNNKNEEEQRRLLYVAMTRAQEILFLCTAKMRKVRGFSFYEPSPFLKEIPSENIVRIENDGHG